MSSMLSIGAVSLILVVCVNTLRIWDKNGFLSPRFRTSGGHRRYHSDDVDKVTRKKQGIETLEHKATIAYARVSTHDQKNDLETQIERLKLECHNRGWNEAQIISDLGSGMNYNKKGLRRLIGLLCRGQVGRLVVLRQDRLLRFGSELIFELCKLHGCEIVVIEPQSTDPKKTIADDVLAILTLFSARCNGMRSHSNKRALAS